MKVRQAARAAAHLLVEPLAFAPAVQFADAVADTWAVRAAYARLGATIDPAHAERLRALQAVPIDVDGLLALPRTTFGAHFARFMTGNGLALDGQLTVAPALAEVFADNWVMDRFVRVHDVHHTLLDVPADPVGEAALQVFNWVNFRDPFGAMGVLAMPLVLRAYKQPSRTARLTAHLARIGRTCTNLLWHPYEEWWADDLDAVRRRVGIDPALVGRVA